jgi:hypothetical protein
MQFNDLSIERDLDSFPVGVDQDGHGRQNREIPAQPQPLEKRGKGNAQKP